MKPQIVSSILDCYLQLVEFQKCAVMLTLLKENFYSVSFVVDRGITNSDL